MSDRSVRHKLASTPQPARLASDSTTQLDRERFELAADRARHAVAAREEERRHLAAELHDVAGTNLAAIKLNLSLLARTIPAAAVEEAHWMADAQELLSETIAGIRDLCGELRSAVPDRAPLADALRAHCLRLTRRTGLTVDLDTAAYDGRCAPEIELMLLRVAQEALWNCAKHANARHVRAWFDNIGKGRRLSILDDGQGFDLHELRDDGTTHGIGIPSMEERAISVGAVFSLESSPRRGTLVRIDF